jgi:hypothetical protein
MAEKAVAVVKRQGQEGGRWINERPSGEDVAKWFESNVQVADGLDVANYISGLTLISSTEKTKETVGFREQTGAPILQEMEHAVFVPYVKVETRVKYFHDLMARNREEWIGFIQPVLPEEPNRALPPGFFRMTVRQKNKEEVVYVCCSMKVTVFKRKGFKEEKVLVDSRNGLYEVHRFGEIVIDGAPATKMVPLLTKAGYSDSNAIMKAETGAVGRALGFAGMLVAPGSGVATAEDMEEAQRIEGAPPAGETPEEAALPGAPGAAVQNAPPEELRPRVIALIDELQKQFPDRHKAFLEWCQERKFAKVSELNEAALKGMIRKVESELDEGRKAAASEPEVADEPEAVEPSDA